MSTSASNSLSTLDKLRTSRGNHELINYFHKLLRSNTSEAFRLINEENVSFPSLFLLRPQINTNYTSRYLNTRKKNSLLLLNAMLSMNSSVFNSLSRSLGSETPEILKWMLETGKDDSGLRNQFDRIIDSCAIILVREYQDSSVLPTIKEIIYNRNREGLFYHDLVWAFFESRNPNCIMMLAEGLKSDDERDVELSQKLLKFIPVGQNETSPRDIQYLNIYNWYRDNYPFLIYTGESFQQKPNPSPFEVYLEAKYLCKEVSQGNGTPESTLNEDELRITDQFSNLDENCKLLLSNYSYLLYRQNIHWWNNWLHSPINEQLKIAVARLGGIPC